MVLPLLLAWSATIDATTTIVGPAGIPEVREAVVEATWESDADGFVYMLDYGAGGPATLLSCPHTQEAAFLAGGEVSREECVLLVRAAGSDSFAPAFSAGRWEDARFPFHLLALAGPPEPWAGAGEGAPPAVAALLPGLAEEKEMSDGEGESSVGRRLEFSGRLWTHPDTPIPVAGRIHTDMYFALQGRVGGVWSPFTEQVLEFFVDAWALPPAMEPALPDLPVAVVSTSLGKFSILLRTDLAPLTAGNFIRLAEAGYFDGTICHRVIEGFVDQCGDPTGTGWGGPGYAFANEVDPALRHDPWMVSMANAGPDTNGSQWFVTVGRIPRLDGNYSVFGEVVEGVAVARLINQVATDQADRPLEPVVIYSVAIEGEHETPPFPEMPGSLADALVNGGQVVAAAARGDTEQGALREGTVGVRPSAAGLVVEVEFAALEGEAPATATYVFNLTGMAPVLVLPEGLGAITGESWALPGSWLFHDEAAGQVLVVWPGEAGPTQGDGDLYHMAWRRPGLIGPTPMRGLVAYREPPPAEEDDGEAAGG